MNLTPPEPTLKPILKTTPMNNYFYSSLEKLGIDPTANCEFKPWVVNQHHIYRGDMAKWVGLAYLISRRRQVVNTKLSHLMSWDGRHRSGKSVTACTFSWLWDKSFKNDFENRIVTDPEDLIKIIETAGKNYTLNKQRGVAIIIDEAGNTLSSSEWYESWAKSINKTVQMFGYLCPQISFVAPVQDYVNSSLRKMFHTHFTMKRFNNDYSVCKPYDLHYNSVTGKKYPRLPIVRFNGIKIKLNSIKLYGIPSEILERYQFLEITRKSKMLEENLHNAYARELEAEERDPQEILKEILEKYKFFLNRKGTGLDKDIIAYHYSLKGKKASYILRLAERELEEILETNKNNPKKVDDVDEYGNPITNKRARKIREDEYNISLEEFNKELGI